VNVLTCVVKIVKYIYTTGLSTASIAVPSLSVVWVDIHTVFLGYGNFLS
jgi:hypothetical protein